MKDQLSLGSVYYWLIENISISASSFEDSEDKENENVECEHEHFAVIDNEEKLPQSSTHEDEGTAKNSDVEPKKCRRSGKGQYVKDGGHK